MEDANKPLVIKNPSVNRSVSKSVHAHHKASVKLDSRIHRLINYQSTHDCHIHDIPDLNATNDKAMYRLMVVSCVCTVFLIAEVVGGLLASSLAILSDAAHLSSDLSGFSISIFAIWLAKKPASESMSFGYHRAEVLGALASILIIWVLTVILLYEATVRIIEKSIVQDPLIMLITSCFGLFCNLVMAKVLYSSEQEKEQKEGEKKVKSKRSVTAAGDKVVVVQESQIDPDQGRNSVGPNPKGPSIIHDSHLEQEQEVNQPENQNLRAAMVHILGDTIQSVGVIIAAVIIYVFGQEKDAEGNMLFTPYQYADPICTYMFSVLVMLTTIGVAKECMSVLMEGIPDGLSFKDLGTQLKSIANVEAIHDLHVWTLSPGKVAMSCHVSCLIDHYEQVLEDATEVCKSFGIYHCTIQIEARKKLL